jgi:MtrB/PioB family decaheme-associated outer membrane protein
MSARLQQACFLLLLAALAAGPTAARAADASASQTKLWRLWAQGEVGVGGRIVWGDTDAAKWLQYRDLEESGPIGDFRFLLEDEDHTYFLRGSGVNLGYDDQRYDVELGRYGLFKLNLFWKELPNELSTDAATIYTRTGSEFTLPAGLQATLQPLAAAAQSAALGVALGGAVGQRLHLQWNEGGANSEMNLSEHLRLRSGYRYQGKQGQNAFSMVFGSPGGNFVTFARPVDEQIHELHAGTDYLRDSWSLSFDYIGSLYDDDFDEVVAANPLVATDALGAASRGRVALPPDNTAHTWSLSGSARLPADFPNRVTGSLAYGIRNQSDDFQPHTINSAIVSPGLALPAGDLDGEVHTILGNLVASARPIEKLSVELRGRVYNYDNKTKKLFFPEHVTTDTSLVDDSPRISVYTDYLTASGDLKGSYDVVKGMTAHLGYGFDYWNRNRAREVENLWEHGPLVQLDYRPLPEWLLRADYQFLYRRGSAYESFSYLFETQPDDAADAAPEFQSPLLRKFDEADRNRHRASVLSRVNPTENTEVTFNGGVWYANYLNSDLGRTEALGWDTGIDGFWQVHERVGLQAFYTYSNEWYDQDSRYRPVIGGVVVDDPLNDWTSKTKNWDHNGGTRVNVSVIPDVLDFETAYMASFGYEKTTASGVPGVPPGQTGTDGGAAVDYPLVEAFLNAVTATLSWNVLENVTLWTQYRFEHYHLDDFRIDQLAPFMPATNTNSRDIWLGQRIDSYTAHLIGFGARYRF